MLSRIRAYPGRDSVRTSWRGGREKGWLVVGWAVLAVRARERNGVAQISKDIIGQDDVLAKAPAREAKATAFGDNTTLDHKQVGARDTLES